MSDSPSRARRNNSPVNITPRGTPPWVGQVSVVGGYSVFDTEINGWRAGAENLVAYQDKHGINTLRGIAYRWAGAPTADDPNNPLTKDNNPEQYAANAGAHSGIQVDQVLNLHDEATQIRVLGGMAWAEDTRVTWDPANLKAGVDLALGISSVTTVTVPATPAAPVAAPTSTPADAFEMWVEQMAGSAQKVFEAGWNAALKAHGLA